MVHLSYMKLDVPWNFSCIRIGWNWSCLWGGGPGAENISQLQFGKSLVALLARGDHTVPLPILTGWLMHLLEFCDWFRGWFCSRWPPHIWLFFWRGICCKYLQVWNSCLDLFISPNLVCLNYLNMIVDFTELVCLISSGIVRILLSCELAWIEFSLIVLFDFRLGSKLPCLFPFLFCFLFIFRFFRTLFHFFSSFHSRERLLVSFLVLYCLSFLRTPLRFFSCFVLYNPIQWHLMSDVCFFFDLFNVYWYGPIQSHMDG